MTDVVLPRYPVYVPSKGRYSTPLTISALLRDEVPFHVVVEPQEYDDYARVAGEERLLVLPWSGNDAVRQQFCAEREIENGGLIAVRNWIKEHSISEYNAERHWQLDDNMKGVVRQWRGKKIPCRFGVALRTVEDFVDRYENVAIAGLNYRFFNAGNIPPFFLNNHVYSCSLIANCIPYRWRIAYNDDTDICLQVLAGGWCTVLVNVFLVNKMRTMLVKGGNTADLYQGDGRLKMARALERLWPGVVETDRRYKRPQHVVKDSWKKFDNQLKLREGVTIEPGVNEYGMKLVKVQQIKSDTFRDLVSDRLGVDSTGDTAA